MYQHYVFACKRQLDHAFKRARDRGAPMFLHALHACLCMYVRSQHTAHKTETPGIQVWCCFCAASMQALSAIGGVPAIHAHTQCLADWLHAQLSALKHPNGKPMVRIIGAWPGSKGAAQATDQESDTKTQTKHSEQGRESTPWGQGPTINFLVLGTDGQVSCDTHTHTYAHTQIHGGQSLD